MHHEMHMAPYCQHGMIARTGNDRRLHSASMHTLEHAHPCMMDVTPLQILDYKKDAPILTLITIGIVCPNMQSKPANRAIHQGWTCRQRPKLTSDADVQI